jgi:hypothetical protein
VESDRPPPVGEPLKGKRSPNQDGASKTPDHQRRHRSGKSRPPQERPTLAQIRLAAVAGAAEAAMSIVASDWRPMVRNSLQGFLTVRLEPSGLVLRECPLHTKGNKRWVGLPSKPQLDAEGCHRIDPTTNKKLYTPIVEITGTEARDRFQKAALEAVDALLGKKSK